MNPLEVVVRILISQLLRGSTPRADNAKACFWWQILSRVFGGHFLLFLGILGVLMLNFAFLTPKRHFLIRKDIFWCISWNFLTSGVGCTLVQEPKKGEKNAIEAVYVGYLPASDPLCKCYEIWHGGSPRVRNRSDRCWSTPVNRFRCVATPKLGPFHWQGPSGLLHCGSRDAHHARSFTNYSYSLRGLYCNTAAKLIQLGYFCSVIATQYWVLSSVPPQRLSIFLFKQSPWIHFGTSQ